MEILPANPADADELLALQRLAYQSEAEIYQDWSIAPLRQTLEELRDELERMTILKACREGRIVGSVRGEEQSGVVAVGRLMVLPSEQRQGIGKRLLDALESEFSQASAFELFTGARSERNLRLYRRQGYELARTEVISTALTLLFLRKAVRS